MMVLLLELGVALAVLVVCVLLSTWRRVRTPRELRGDWWARFESDFRAHAGRGSTSADPADRRPRDSDPGRK